MPLCLNITNGCFHTTTAKLNSCDKNHVAHKARNIYYLALNRKSLLTPNLWDYKVGTMTREIKCKPYHLRHRRSASYGLSINGLRKIMQVITYPRRKLI